MAVLLFKADVPPLFIAPVALMWGYLILSFDGWLVASTYGCACRKWRPRCSGLLRARIADLGWFERVARTPS
jgi:hypothetical protein